MVKLGGLAFDNLTRSHAHLLGDLKSLFSLGGKLQDFGRLLGGDPRLAGVN
jgi:hypothetical protein